ncbi:ATP-grasp domain-containing protein [Kribbella antibiotica]|uniref:ATP-grasp domain-containing protein n=1 Tax=Kribbella antibiotica TaxID=190195 RepID=A0A4V2YQB8_9ACTN|nr:ATP-grasp domain-containing protein [Kribbella antibiotica]TDD61517.1 ATP-grasp domain-containing protein [Kribbella antibiotica]
MKTLPRVGIVHLPYGAANLPDVCRAAVDLCQPVFLFHQATVSAHPDIAATARLLAEVHIVHKAGLSETVGALALDGITTFHDDALDAVDATAAEHGLPGPADQTQPWDKLVQRNRLAAAGLTRVRALKVDSPAQLQLAAQHVGLPAVLKPRRGVGGGHIAMINSPDDINHQLRHREKWQGLMLETRLSNGAHPASSPVLADFVSVETVNTADSNRHVAIFDKTPVEIIHRAAQDGADAIHVTGDITPSRLPAQEREAVARLVSSALRVLGVRWRMTHTEVKLTPNGPEIIEINGRVGGHLNRLLKLTNGHDLVRSALSLAIARVPSSPTSPARGWAAGLFPPLADRHSEVKTHVSAAQLRRLPGVAGVDAVALYGQTPEECGYRMANITLRAGTASELDRHLLTARRHLDEVFGIEPGTARAWYRELGGPLPPGDASSNTLGRAR